MLGECSEQVSENFRNGKIFRRQKFFVGNNFCRHWLFLDKYFGHLKKSSPLFTDNVFTYKVGSDLIFLAMVNLKKLIKPVKRLIERNKYRHLKIKKP